MIQEITREEFLEIRKQLLSEHGSEARVFRRDDKFFKEYKSIEECHQDQINYIRARRDKECFSVINRGNKLMLQKLEY